VEEGTYVINVYFCIFNLSEDVSHYLLGKIREHLSPIGNLLYLNLPKGVAIVHKFFDSSSNSNV
jgi:hypothetical protein